MVLVWRVYSGGMLIYLDKFKCTAAGAMLHGHIIAGQLQWQVLLQFWGIIQVMKHITSGDVFYCHCICRILRLT